MSLISKKVKGRFLNLKLIHEQNTNQWTRLSLKPKFCNKFEFDLKSKILSNNAQAFFLQKESVATIELVPDGKRVGHRSVPFVSFLQG